MNSLTKHFIAFQNPSIGGLTVPFDILAEFLPTHQRGEYLLLIEYYWTAGSMIVPILAYITLELLNSWRIFVAVCSIPCVVSFVASQMYVPESPRWLISKGRNREAMDVLRFAVAVNGKDPDVTFPEGCVLKDEVEETSSFADLLKVCMCVFVWGFLLACIILTKIHILFISNFLKPKWRTLTLLLWAVWFGLSFCYFGSVMIITRVFANSNDGNGGDDDNAVGRGFDYKAIFISSFAELVGTALAIAVVDRVGRIPTQVCTYTIGGISIFCLCLLTNTAQRTMLITLAFIVRVNEMMASCVTWISTSEVLSTEIRTTGTYTIGRCDSYYISLSIRILLIHSPVLNSASLLTASDEK